MYEETSFVSTVDGRKICVLQAGMANGIAIMVHAGTPGSRLLFEGWSEYAVGRGVRLIAYDRPGYGGSTPAAGRTVSAAADDVAAIVRYLGIERIGVWGLSGGGPHALACAALLPSIVVAAATFGSLAPRHTDDIDWFAGMGTAIAAEFSAAIDGRVELEQVIQAAAREMLSTDPDSLASTWRDRLCPTDIAELTRDTASYLLESARVGLSNGVDGWIDDDMAFVSPWGFDISQIGVPVMIVHGQQDKSVPISHARWLIERIHNAQARLSAQDGHISAFAHSFAQVHDWLIEKMTT